MEVTDKNGKILDPDKIDWNKYSAGNFPFIIRQKAGPWNALGEVKFIFPNKYSVYLHDTPSESLFGRNFRAASSGCVRVHNIEDLSAWLLSGNRGWDKSQVLNIKESGDTKNVRLKRPVTLYLAYITAWATSDGVIQFRRDIYRKDGIGRAAASY